MELDLFGALYDITMSNALYIITCNRYDWNLKEEDTHPQLEPEASLGIYKKSYKYITSNP